jgi:hypothetical protein
MKPVALIVAWAVVGLVASAATAQPDAADQTLARMDRNRDGAIDRAELRAFLRVELGRRAAELGLSGGVPFEAVVDKLTDQALNAANAGSPQSDDLVQRAEIPGLLTYSVDVFNVTVAELLEIKSPNPHEAWTDRFGHWFNVRQSALQEQSIAKPATLSYVSRDQNDQSAPTDPVSQWAVHGALILNSPKDFGFAHGRWTPLAAYDVQIDSDASAKDLITTRGGLLGSITTDSLKALSSHYVWATFDYTTDRHHAAAMYGGTVQYSPTSFPAAIGRYRGTRVRFRWRPYALLTFAHVSNPGELDALKDVPNYVNGELRATPEVVLARLIFAPTFHVWHQFKQEHQTFGYVQWAGRVVLSESDGQERASLAVEYDRGHQSPTFEQTGVLTVGIGVKF